MMYRTVASSVRLGSKNSASPVASLRSTISKRGLGSLSSPSFDSRNARYRSIGYFDVSANVESTSSSVQLRRFYAASAHNDCIGLSHIFSKQHFRRYHDGIFANNASLDDAGSVSNNSVLSSASGNSPPRPQMRIGDLLKGLENRNFAVTDDYSVEDAIAHLVKEKLGSSLVTDESGSVLGIFTARDLLRFIYEKNPHNPNFPIHLKNATQGTHLNLHECLHNTKITDIMTKREKIVYCSPSDSVKHCREIMFQLKIRNLPVLDGNRIRGIMTVKVLADAYFNAADVGGKKSYMINVIGRKGIPDTAKVLNSSNAGMVNSDTGGATGEYIDLRSSSTVSAFLDLEVGAFALPHPFKHPSGVAIDRRNYGPYDLATDLSLSEDAYFAMRVKDPMFASCPTSIDPKNEISGSVTSEATSDNVNLPVAIPKRDSQVYLCVADGVGSWRQFGVDPRQYPVA